MINMNLFQTIKKDKKAGLGIRQISRKLKVSRKTVTKYFKMSDVEYIKYQKTAYKKEQVFEPFRNEVLEIYQLNENRVYASSVYDLLEEKYGTENLPGTERTLRNYISYLLRTGEILKSPNYRSYSPVEELPFGKQLQVDFGQLRINTGETVYIFASVLSASRYRYVAVQQRPFTTLDVILHLLDCFEYIGGTPKQIVIDQDRTMVVSENSGDIILTKSFQQFQDEIGFELYVCRKADPESKGKVENLVKFVKTSFFSARVFDDFEDVQSSLSSWLVRKANGKISQATGLIPANLLEREQEKLYPLRASMFKKDSILEREDRKVDSKSFISVDSCKYSVPISYRCKTVWIYKSETKLFIYNDLAGKEIAYHMRSFLPGEIISKKQHFKDNCVKQTQLRDELVKKVPVLEWQDFVQKNYKRYTRYFREQHASLNKFLSGGYEEELLSKALLVCEETGGYSAKNLEEAYAYVKGVAEDSHDNLLPKLLTGIQAVKADSRNPKVVQRKLSYYSSLVSILGSAL